MGAGLISACLLPCCLRYLPAVPWSREYFGRLAFFIFDSDWFQELSQLTLGTNCRVLKRIQPQLLFQKIPMCWTARSLSATSTPWSIQIRWVCVLILQQVVSLTACLLGTALPGGAHVSQDFVLPVGISVCARLSPAIAMQGPSIRPRLTRLSHPACYCPVVVLMPTVNCAAEAAVWLLRRCGQLYHGG